MNVRFMSFNEVHADLRRTIHELDLPFTFDVNRVNRIAVTEDGPQRLGDHHHDVMTELFVLVTGVIEKLTVTNSDGGDLGTYTGIKAPVVILMPTGVDHTFVLAPGSVLLTLSDKSFDESDIIKCSPEHKAAAD
ncbi:MAG: WxcM-like domain-containing protein [Patescibacteria group bacterium]